MSKTATITPEFLDYVDGQTTQVEYAAKRTKGAEPALTVLSIGSPDMPPEQRYYYSRRAGKDSVAFVLYDATQVKPYQLLAQWHGPLKKINLGAFTGSIDKPGLSPLEHLLEEIKEEAGYTVSAARATQVGYEPVSSQTDECVYLYVVNITGLTPHRKTPENLFEANTQRYWCTAAAALRHGEWKSKVIVHAAERRRAQ